MTISRRLLLGSAAAAAALPLRRARAQAAGAPDRRAHRPVRHLSRYVGPTGLACARQAVQEFTAGGFDVEVLAADHQNKPDIAVAIAGSGSISDGVDMILDVADSACALALTGCARRRTRSFPPAPRLPN